MLECLAGQPAPMRQRPMASSAIDPAVPEQKGQQLLALAAKIVRPRLAGAHKIAHRLMCGIGRPHARQFAGPIKPRQRDRVAPVRLHPLARSFRDQRRSDHHAVVAERLNLTIKPISRRPGLEADMQPIVSLRQSLDHPRDRQGAVLDFADKPDLPGPAAFRNRHRVLRLGDVESDKHFAILSHGPPSVHEARLGPCPSNPRFSTARKGGPPAKAPRTCAHSEDRVEGLGEFLAYRGRQSSRAEFRRAFSSRLAASRRCMAEGRAGLRRTGFGSEVASSAASCALSSTALLWK